MLPQENFEVLHDVIAILVLFEHFSGKFCLNFLTLILSGPTSPNMMHFVSLIFNYACLRRTAYCYQRGSKL